MSDQDSGYSTSPSLSSINSTANGQSSRFGFPPRIPCSLLWPWSHDLLLHSEEITLKSFQEPQRQPQNNSLPPSVPSSRATHWRNSHQQTLWQLCKDTHQNGWRSSHLYRWPKRTPLFWKIRIKFTARSYGNMSGTMCMSASCLLHGYSIFKLSKKQSC